MNDDLRLRLEDLQDAIPLDAVYRERARAAVKAARAALADQSTGYNDQHRGALIEAIGRIASALILSPHN